MGPVTVTAARIYKGEKQLAAQPGSLVSPERANLSMQLLPYAARIKTFRWMARPPTAPRPWPPT